MDRSRSIQANSGTAAAALMSPVSTPHSTSFLQANRSQLKHLQQLNRERQQLALEQSQQQPFKMERFKHVGSAIGRAMEARKEQVRGKERPFLRKDEGRSVVKRGVNPQLGHRMEQQQRTSSALLYVDDDAEAEAGEEETVYAMDDGRYRPSGTSLREGVGMHLPREQEEKQAMSSAAPSPPYSARSSSSSASAARSSTWSASAASKNFIAANALSVIHAPASVPPPEPAPVPLHSAFGRVPAYLTARNAEMAAKRDAEKAAKAARAIPAGMRLVGEEERLATLERLRENFRAVEKEVMALPLRCETVSRKRHKAELEARLKDLEDAIALFSKKTVYITLE